MREPASLDDRFLIERKGEWDEGMGSAWDK